MAEISFEITEHDLEFLREIHRSSALKELTQHPGWPIYQEIVQNVIARLQDKHMRFSRRASKEQYWIDGVRVDAANEFANMLVNLIAQSLDLLKQPLIPPDRKLDEADMDGDILQ